MSNVLVVRDLKKVYTQGHKSLEILKSVSFDLEKGKSAALIGQSGAGKSTLLHCVGLLDQPTSGKIKISGKLVSNKDDKQRTAIRRAQLGFVYQFHYLQPEFTALENIMMPLMIIGQKKNLAKERGLELLEKMGLKDRGDHRPARLSGGEQQRVAIARALANRPKFLLADEPTGNLDEETSKRIFDLLLTMIRDEGISALIATHNQRLAADMDKVLTLRNGSFTE